MKQINKARNLQFSNTIIVFVFREHSLLWIFLLLHGYVEKSPIISDNREM